MSLSIDFLVSGGTSPLIWIIKRKKKNQKTYKMSFYCTVVQSHDGKKGRCPTLRCDHKIRLDSETKIVFQFGKEL